MILQHMTKVCVTKYLMYQRIYWSPRGEEGKPFVSQIANIWAGFNVTVNRSYYKNVRKEWASLVATPSYARFQDALAFTRSLGDLHLHTYGKDSTHPPKMKIILFN